MATFEVGKPAPYYCKACEAVPQAGYCKMAGCPTAPEVVASKHTPGPWTVEGEFGGSALVRGDGYIVVSCNGKTAEQERANARLIAKAPDMLAELKRCLMGCGDRERIANLIAEAEGN